MARAYLSVAAPEYSIEDVSAVELSHGEQVEPLYEESDPGRGDDRVLEEHSFHFEGPGEQAPCQREAEGIPNVEAEVGRKPVTC